jgi:hypothetical protein
LDEIFDLKFVNHLEFGCSSNMGLYYIHWLTIGVTLLHDLE